MELAFGISIDPGDRILEERIAVPDYFTFLWDFEGELSDRYGVCQPDKANGGIIYEPMTFVLDENLRILNILPLEQQKFYVEQIISFINRLSAPAPPILAIPQAPVLMIPNVFAVDFCQHLIQLYRVNGGKDSGFMQQKDNKTAEVLARKTKQRRDFLITEKELLQQINSLVWRRVKPEILKVFQFEMTCFERYLVASYESTQQGFFRPHRDNVTVGTVHRRFAMTLNLNTGEYEGGCLRFPEYGTQLYRPNIGDAIVFSCSLLHEVTPVTQGQRFALLSFFYNDEDAKVRQQNQKHVVLKK